MLAVLSQSMFEKQSHVTFMNLVDELATREQDYSLSLFVFQNIEPKMVELIMNEIMDNGPSVTWDDIAGLELAKSTIQVGAR